MKEITKERKRPTVRKRRRRSVAVLLPAALLGIAATSYVVLSSDEVVAAGIGCFDEAHLEGNVTIVSTSGESPEEVCGKFWAEGVVRHGTSSAPALMPCVNESGAVYVFPSKDESICTRLGLQALPEGYEREAKRFTAMRDELIRRMYETATAGPATDQDACLTQQQSLEVARAVLSDYEFNEWSAEIHPGDYEGRACANNVAFDDRAKKVLVIPSDQGIDPDPFGPH